jgi:formate dehydrogenase major subunit
VPGLGTTAGRGGATTAQPDLANANCVLIEGSSMAEQHPVGFRWVMAAKERGATLIHVDPRYTRTSALADLWVPIRAGSDIAFLGGLIRHVIENDLYFREYVVHYTNASCLLREDFRDTEDGHGLFSGWHEEKRRYETESWPYQGGTSHPERDPTLQHPRCVFQVLRRHFQRYTPEMVQRVCGIPPDLFARVAEAITRNSGPDRTTAICYAVGWTQHSKGVQTIRAAGILQLLLGNIGRPGGGILALRGHASIQGSTDIPTLYDILPGYMPMPKAGHGEDTLKQYVDKHAHETGGWSRVPEYMVSLLRAWYGRNATRDDDWGYPLLPRLTGDHSHFAFFDAMADGRVEGLFVMGQNPAVGAPNARFQRKAMSKLKWLVVRDLVETETASFWRTGPDVERGDIVPEECETEVFLFPASGHAEKAGGYTNTQRLYQFREKAVSPEGDRRSEAWFIHQLALRLKARAAASGDPIDEPLRALDWWYPEEAEGGPEPEAVLAEINGWHTDPTVGPDGVVYGHDRDRRPHHGAQVANYHELKDDGTTACGCWIYSGIYGPDRVNRALQRQPRDAQGHGWGFAWPDDRRILYNRASAAPDGTPWSEEKRLVWWDAAQKKWTGLDVPDFPEDKAPDYRPPPHARGVEAHPGDAPFVMHPDGLGWLYGPSGVADGPLPTHYEPIESTEHNPLYLRQTDPAVYWFTREGNTVAPPGDPRFPYVLTTYRVTEHHTAGGMTRHLSHLAELQPALFCELSPELATTLGVCHGDWVSVVTLRGAVEARAVVSRRIRPLAMNGHVVHQVGLPYHWGWTGEVEGAVVNDLLAMLGEPTVTIQESKALVCNVVAGRVPRGDAFHLWHAELTRPLPGVPQRHPDEPPQARAPGHERPGGHGHEGKT